MQHVVIAGAGIIGLSAALELVEAGFRVTVLERGRAMHESSWAAAGMLAVDDPENAPELLPLSRLSRGLYPAFLEKVERLSGVRVPLRTCRTLQGSQRSSGAPCAADELPELVADEYRFSLLDEASLDPRDLSAALPRAAEAAGVTLREGWAVLSVARRHERLWVEPVAGEALAADHFVLAGGAWSGLVGLPEMSRLPVAPRKGQMIEVALDRPALPMVVRTPELYLVPRGDGRIAIGATVEDAGFDRAVDEPAGDRLWQAAGGLWPPVLRGRITARWTGLRPGCPDALPVIGGLSDGVWVATGHFRNGILLAPGTAQIIRQLLLGEMLSVPLNSFAPERFAPEFRRFAS